MSDPSDTHEPAAAAADKKHTQAELAAPGESVTRNSSLDTLEERVGHCFRDKQVLRRALTHRSWLAERGVVLPEEGDNEQLEFLGDAILGFVVSEALTARYPDAREGRLSQLKAHLVSANYLYTCALQLDLGSFLQLGKGEERTGGRSRRTVLANAFEALIAALHLDGGLAVARAMIERRVLGRLAEIEQLGPVALLNYKSLLQERASALGLAFPRYITVGTSGPEHAKLFTIEAKIGEALSSRATASSKKAASQQAAESLYALLADKVAG